MTTRSRTRRPAAVAIAALALIVAAACSEDRSTGADDAGDRADVAAPDCVADDLLACVRASTIADLVPAKPATAAGEPIVLGMINQENTPVGSFPELSRAVEAAIAFVNAELGGVDGRPLDLEVCNTRFSPEGSTGCAQDLVERGVPAVLGGIDVFGTGIETLADNGIPYVGGIPVSAQAATSPNSFQWSGGIWGATLAFADHAARVVEAERAAVVYGEFGPIADAAAYGRRALERAGVDVALVPYPVTATDLTSPLQAALATEPDALILLVADTGCKPAFEGVHALGTTATVYYVGACATPNIVGSVDPDATEGAVFNVEGPIDRDDPDPDAELYGAVIERYGDGLDPVGAGTVSFRSFVNLYRVLRDLGADGITPEAITGALAAQRDAPSFMGHPSTCDGRQLAGLPALCSPQQILAELRDGELTQVGTWIDVGRVAEPG